MAMQSKAWMTTFIFKEFLFFFKRFIPNGMSITNSHLFILDGHGSHVTLETIEQAQEFDYFTFATISCTLTLGCGLLQAFQDCFQKGKRHING
jgi:hypothetical protein